MGFLINKPTESQCEQTVTSMTFVNSYKPPAPLNSQLSSMQDPYDINWAFPLPPLETARVKLIPFIPSLHAQTFFDSTKDYPDLFHHMAFVFPTLEAFLEMVEVYMHIESGAILFTIIDKTKPDLTNSDLGGSLAGVIGLFHSSESNLSTEIGPIIVTPPFQRTHVSSNAIGILLRYCFELPSAGGLGFRRVQWTANQENLASVKAAEKVGFVYEGTMRWTWILPEGKEGKKSREGDPRSGLGRDSALLAVCWDDWESGVKEHVDRMIEKV